MIGVGELVAQEILGTESDLLKPFRFNRYEKGELHPTSNLNHIKWLAKQFRLYFEPVNSFVWHILDAGASIQSYIGFYLNLLVLPYASVTSILGFLLLQGITMQLLSGFFLAWYYVPEPSMVCEFREEMFIDTAYGFEIFQLHVRGVDFLMLLSYAHIFKKIYLKNYINTESDG
jgi:hypothetical protein